MVSESSDFDLSDNKSSTPSLKQRYDFPKTFYLIFVHISLSMRQDTSTSMPPPVKSMMVLAPAATMPKKVLFAKSILENYIFFGKCQIKMMSRIDFIPNAERRGWRQ